jgi:opacity protein-like surface antigen
MKRLILFVVLAGLMVSAGGARAQYKDQAVLLTLSGGALLTTSDVSGQSITGNAANFTFEKVVSEGKVSVGIAIPYIFADETVTGSEQVPEKITYSGTPVMLTCKYNILNGRFAAYAGAGIGVHWSSLKRHEGTVDEVSSSFTGMALGVPVGVAFFLAEDLYLQGVYSLSYMSTTPLRDDIAHGFMLGLGFQWGTE